MTRTTEIAKNTAVAAVLVAGLGEAGTQATFATTPNPIGTIANQIAAQPQTTYRDGVTSAHLTLSGETVDLSFSAPNAVNGGPDPTEADRINMDVRLTNNKGEATGAPIIQITLDKNNNGSWNAEETIGLDTNSSSTLSEYAGKNVVRYTQSPQGKTGYKSTASKKDAKDVLVKIEQDAASVASLAARQEPIYVERGRVIGPTATIVEAQ
jgi:hypothetical protein